MNNSMTRQQRIGAMCGLISILLADESIPLPHDMGLGTELLFCHTKEELGTTCRALGAGTYGEDENGFTFIPHAIPFVKVYGFRSGIIPAPAVAVEPRELEQPGAWAPEPFDDEVLF
jgi:hypothetical protein